MVGFIMANKSIPSHPFVLCLFLILACSCSFTSPRSSTDVSLDIEGTQPRTTPVMASPTSMESTPADIPTQVLQSATPGATAMGRPELAPVGWKLLPVLPTMSPQAVDIFQNGLALGNNPQAFSKVGDGEIASSWFLTMFDLDPPHYDLGSHEYLEPVIETYAGSFEHVGVAAHAGFSTTLILDPLLATNDICEVEESPLECELRRHRPSFAFISLGTNQVWTPDVFATELRQMVEICIERGVVPILATKGDNLEGDHRINAIIAEVAREYEIPLWNFWLALQSLPNQGLQADGEHLTWAVNDFDDPEAMAHAWPVRNLTALQVLHGLMTQLELY